MMARSAHSASPAPDVHPPTPPQDLWRPISACNRRCLQEPSPTAGRARRALRLAAGLVVMLGALVLALADHLLLRRGGRGLRLWFRAFLRALGIRLEVHGGEEVNRMRGTLLVSNHVSWLDLPAINAAVPSRFVVKSELRSWPFVATLAKSRNSIYLDRARPTTLPLTVADVTRALRAGGIVGVFPESTTWCGRAGGTYRPALLQAAIDAGAPVRPVVLRYRTSRADPATSVAFVDTSLANSLRNVVSERWLCVEVHVLPELVPLPGESRRELAARVRTAAENVRHESRASDPHRPVIQVLRASHGPRQVGGHDAGPRPPTTAEGTTGPRSPSDTAAKKGRAGDGPP